MNGERTPQDVPDITLAEFLRARLDEDEQTARTAIREWGDRHDQGRVIFDVQAKRMIVDTWQTAQTNVRVDRDEYSKGYAAAFERVLRHLAKPYRHHPDYRREWSPWAG